MLETILQYLGAGDNAIVEMGPTLTVVLAFLFSYGVTQYLKDWVKLLGMQDRFYDLMVRTIASVLAFAFAFLLGGLKSWVFALGVGFLQPVVVHMSLQVIWKRWPHLKTTRALGSTHPTESDIAAAVAHGTRMRPSIITQTESGRFKIDPLDTQRMKALADASKDSDVSPNDR
jgi:hypothetical protein